MDVHNYSGMNSYGENGYYYKDTKGFLISLQKRVPGNIQVITSSYSYSL
ncbi:hypothetical protein QW060_18030 [Myroides ceti]|uniref:Uncharacterized protein n=1 Tax=Paenimyroides ceti TaxID=395087 RepID=A0ABT8CY81_9FLAO|nr:hypothetical protein [Paenimyroides ceti]MDN3708976.1 hypothetical protein [Paenimyroides ceti]